MSPASFRISLDAPEAPPPPPSKPINPAALTREERSNMGWHVRFIAWVLGLPSILSIGFVCCVGLYYANVATGDVWTRLALSVGILVITLFTAGLPIGAALNRDSEPGIARAAFGFWIACLALNVAVMGNFAWHRPEAAPVAAQAPVRASVSVPHLSAAQAERLDWDIAGLWYTLADFDELVHGPRRERFDTPQNRQLYAAQYARLQQLETKRYGAPVILKEIGGELEFKGYAAADEPAAKAVPAAASAPGLDLAAVALLMLIGAALGLLISASSLAAILTEKAATVRVEAETAPAPQPAPLPLAAYHPAESADGFEHWAASCLSRVQGGRIRPAEAHASYLAFCARNDYAAPLAIQEFGRRLRSWLSDTYGLNALHSNGTVYEGVTLAPLAPSITAPTKNGVTI